MAEQTIIVHIKGYWREQHKQELPETGGIIFIYEAIYNSIDDTADLLKLIYIDSAENIREKVLTHELADTWMKFLNPGNELCFAIAMTEEQHRERIKLAFIASHFPPVNGLSPIYFPFDTTTLISTGKTALLSSVITVRNHPNSLFPASGLIPTSNWIPVRSVPVL
ncbi:MAG: hypothetical protein M0P47_05050 [Bacteroidales bacterium]|nr:hypothetical protein [Bacteroidales bacterium]